MPARTHATSTAEAPKYNSMPS